MNFDDLNAYIIFYHDDGTYESRRISHIKNRQQAFDFAFCLDTDEKRRVFMDLSPGVYRPHENLPLSSKLPECLGDFSSVAPFFEITKTEQSTWMDLYAHGKIGGSIDLVFRENRWYVITELDADEDALELVPLADLAFVYGTFKQLLKAFMDAPLERGNNGELSFDVEFSSGLLPKDIRLAHQIYQAWDPLSHNYLNYAFRSDPELAEKFRQKVSSSLDEYFLVNAVLATATEISRSEFRHEMAVDFNLDNKSKAFPKKL